jgi:hypothetical protein
MTEPTDSVKRDLFHLVCGKVLGAGVARTVYEHAFDPTVVIKVEEGAGSFQNVAEWQVWERIQYTALARWFAPCVAISPNGSVLVQRRTRAALNYPDKVPSFFTDIKPENFGMLDGNFVAHDYGYHLMLENGMSKRMKKADWVILP